MCGLLIVRREGVLHDANKIAMLNRRIFLIVFFVSSFSYNKSNTSILNKQLKRVVLDLFFVVFLKFCLAINFYSLAGVGMSELNLACVQAQTMAVAQVGVAFMAVDVITHDGCV